MFECCRVCWESQGIEIYSFFSPPICLDAQIKQAVLIQKKGREEERGKRGKGKGKGQERRGEGKKKGKMFKKDVMVFTENRNLSDFLFAV